MIVEEECLEYLPIAYFGAKALCCSVYTGNVLYMHSPIYIEIKYGGPKVLEMYDPVGHISVKVDWLRLERFSIEDTSRLHSIKLIDYDPNYPGFWAWRFMKGDVMTREMFEEYAALEALENMSL